MSEYDSAVAGRLDGNGEAVFDQERLARDFALTQIVQIGYTPAEELPGRPKPNIVDGNLDEKGQQALARLWHYYRPAAIGLAKRFEGRIHSRPTIDIDDLINEGFFGLYHAAIKWHPDKGITLLTQARNYMGNHMRRYIQNQETTIRVPANIRENIRSLGAISWRSYQTSGRFPVRKQLADTLGTSNGIIEEIQQAEAMSYQMGSLDNGYFEDDRDRKSIQGAGMGRWKPIDPAATEQLAVDQDALLGELTLEIRLIMANKSANMLRGGVHLSDKEIDILRLRFFDRLTLEETGRELGGLSRERVRQIEARTLSRLRQPRVAELLRAYLAA